MWAVSVWDTGLAMHTGIHAGAVAAELREQAVTALHDANAAYHALEQMLVKGAEVPGLLGTATNLEADLVSVGSHGTSRPAGVLFGSVATAIAHHAPCSALIAREATEEFPRVILHATDGSPEALEAAKLAASIGARHGARVVSLCVDDDQDRGRAVVEESAALIERGGREPELRVERGSPDRQIVETASGIGAELIAIGSRGRTGLRALGSVSERVAHRAPCSVLIARRAAHPARDG